MTRSTQTQFHGRALATSERSAVARWIAARQGLPGAYGGTFAGFPAERSKGIVLFSGERIASASARHILGEEASRVLRLLRVQDRNVTRALEAADEGLLRCGWRRFPFWYTVLALSEMDGDEAKAELKYAAPLLEAAASRAVPSAVYARRRHELAGRVLNRL